MQPLQKIFEYEGNQVRTVVRDDEPWFVAKDVCSILEITNSRDAIARLDDDEKGVVLTDTPGGQQEMLAVNEPGLYTLVIGSRKPEAKRFKRWITHEVIPSIRKTGQYVAQPKSQAELLLMYAEQFVQMEKRVETLEDGLTTVKETFLKRDENWRNSINSMLNSVAFRSGGNYRDLRNKSYEILEERGRCNLNIRLSNLKDRLKDSGATKTKIRQTTKLDVIESDPRLKEIYATIVKELSIGSIKLA